jgi:Tol biopolymer transport system component
VGGASSSSFNIFVINRDGSGLTALTTNTAANRNSIRARWSPDGTEIVFLSQMNIGATASSSYNVWKMAADGTNPVALTTNTASGMNADRAYFRPDGQSIVFSSLQPLTGSTASIHMNIWTMNGDGTNQVARTSATAGTARTKDSLLGRGNVWFVEQ